MKISRIIAITLTVSLLISSTVYSMMERPEDSSPRQRTWVKPALAYAPAALVGGGLGYLSYRGYKNQKAIMEKVKAKKAERNIPFDSEDKNLIYDINEAITMLNLTPRVWKMLTPNRNNLRRYLISMDPDVRSALAEQLNLTPIELFEKIVGKQRGNTVIEGDFYAF